MTERADALASARIGVAVLLGPKEAEKQGAGNEGWSADGVRAEWRGKVGMCSAVVCVRRGRVCWCVNLLTSLSIMGMAVGAGLSPWRASGPGSSQGERGARAGWMDVVGLVRAGAPVWTGRGWARPQRRAAFTWRPGPARMGASAKTAYGGGQGKGVGVRWATSSNRGGRCCDAPAHESQLHCSSHLPAGSRHPPCPSPHLLGDMVDIVDEALTVSDLGPAWGQHGVARGGRQHTDVAGRSGGGGQVDASAGAGAARDARGRQLGCQGLLSRSTDAGGSALRGGRAHGAVAAQWGARVAAGAARGQRWVGAGERCGGGGAARACWGGQPGGQGEGAICVSTSSCADRQQEAGAVAAGTARCLLSKTAVPLLLPGPPGLVPRTCRGVGGGGRGAQVRAGCSSLDEAAQSGGRAGRGHRQARALHRAGCAAAGRKGRQGVARGAPV